MTESRATGVALALAVVLLAGAVRAGLLRSPVPWNKGDRVVGSWTVHAVDRHDEFVRLELACHDEPGELPGCATGPAHTTVVEVVANEAKDDYWETRHYRVQPAPRSTPPREVLRSVLDRLELLDSAPDHEPFVDREVVKRGATVFRQAVGPESPPLVNGLWGANALALLLLGALALVWVRARPEQALRTAGVLVGATVCAVALVLLVDPARLSASWITVMHEGRGRQNIEQLYGQAVHAGPNFGLLVDLIADGAGATLKRLVVVNLATWVVASALFLLVAWHVVERWWAALLLTAAFAFNNAALHGVASELPAALLALYLMAGTVAAAVLADRRRLGDVAATAAVALVFLVGLLMTATREELAIVWVPSSAMAIAVRAGAAPALERAGNRVASAIRRLGSGGSLRWVLAVVSAVALVELHRRVELGGRAAWAWDALSPGNTSILMLPALLARMVPLGALVLVLFGLAHGVRRWVAFLALPLLLVVLFRLYMSASHGVFYERLRYMTIFVPYALLLAPFGWLEVERLLRRFTVGKHWRAAAVTGLVALTALHRPVDAAPGPSTPYRAPTSWLISRDQQISLRFLVDLVERNPECVLVTKVARDERSEGTINKWDYIYFGRLLGRPHIYPEPAGTAVDVARAIAPGASCVLFYRGLDCNLLDGDLCAQQVRPRHAVELRSYDSLTYSDPLEYGEVARRVKLGAYHLWPGRPRGIEPQPSSQPIVAKHPGPRPKR